MASKLVPPWILKKCEMVSAVPCESKAESELSSASDQETAAKITAAIKNAREQAVAFTQHMELGHRRKDHKGWATLHQHQGPNFISSVSCFNAHLA